MILDLEGVDQVKLSFHSATPCRQPATDKAVSYTVIVCIVVWCRLQLMALHIDPLQYHQCQALRLAYGRASPAETDLTAPIQKR